MKKLFKGMRGNAYKLVVAVDGLQLDPRLDIASISPNGFECGYDGVGAKQLAIALLAACPCSDDQVLRLYEKVSRDLIAQLPRDGWTMTSDQILGAISQTNQ